MCAVKIKIENPCPQRPKFSAEFGHAATGTRILRSALFKLLKNPDDPRHTNRLNAKMLKIVQSDPIHAWGERTVAGGDLTLLEGFDFSIKKQLHRMLLHPFTADINRKTGVCVVHLPEFVPQDEITLRGSHTHVVFVAAAVEVNFNRECFVTKIVKSDCLDVRKPVSVTLHPTLPKASKHPILLAFGLHFYHVVNGIAYSMCDREVSSLCIVKVDNAPTPPVKKKSLK